MGNFYEDMFTSGGKKKKSGSKSKPYDWMKDAIGDSTQGSKNPAMMGFDINSVIGTSKSNSGSKSKKSKEPTISQTIQNTQKSIKNVKSTIHTIRNFKDDQAIIKAKEIEAREKRAREVAEAKAKIADYNERKAEYEAREKERRKERGEQTVLERLRNFRKNKDKGTPSHLQTKQGE